MNQATIESLDTGNIDNKSERMAEWSGSVVEHSWETLPSSVRATIVVGDNNFNRPHRLFDWGMEYTSSVGLSNVYQASVLQR